MIPTMDFFGTMIFENLGQRVFTISDPQKSEPPYSVFCGIFLENRVPRRQHNGDLTTPAEPTSGIPPPIGNPINACTRAYGPAAIDATNRKCAVDRAHREDAVEARHREEAVRPEDGRKAIQAKQRRD